ERRRLRARYARRRRDGRRPARGAARGGRARGAPRASAHPTVLLREQAPREAGGARLVRQRHERGLQPGPGALGAGALSGGGGNSSSGGAITAVRAAKKGPQERPLRIQRGERGGLSRG